ncbi:MAG: phytoene/squalene synthase family protein [Marinifilaceae bacterium]|jgi:phytoene/squalene synthetase|nr:phytoene/squalene synthase family protein [Marinifilaceae bacterium]
MNIDFYIDSCFSISKLITRKYSTSFSLACSFLKTQQQKAIYSLYGFVRLCDEVVDSFHDQDKEYLLDKLESDLDYAIENGISTNPVIDSFTKTIFKYNIDRSQIASFIKSMRSDIDKNNYNNNESLDEYIYGSADVVGLMCLMIFCNGDKDKYENLKYSAQKLGSAFQKVNFLRDLHADINGLGRCYFPELCDKKFSKESKLIIEKSIRDDFNIALKGIKKLPGRSKLAVSIAYFYYIKLFKKLEQNSFSDILAKRTRISNFRKYLIFLKVSFMYKTKLI